MKCELLFASPLWLSSNAIRMSKDNHNKGDSIGISVGGTTTLVNAIGEKDKELIYRVGNKMKHNSTLEFLQYVFDVEISTKTLLAFSRHRVGISLTMRSTRYTTKKNKGKHKVQYSEKTKDYLDRIMNIVDEAIDTGMSDDECSLLLPQAYVYRGQIQFNGRSLQHFLSLRTDKSAHFQIRKLANGLFSALPEDHKYLYEDFVKADIWKKEE